MRIRHPSHTAAFQIDRLSARRREQPALGIRIRGNLVTSQQAMPVQTPEACGQRSIGGEPTAAANHGIGYDNHPRPQRRIEPAGQPEAHQRRRAVADQPGRGLSRPGRGSATNGNRPAEALSDPRLRRQAGDEPDQKPNSTRCVLPWRRLR